MIHLASLLATSPTTTVATHAAKSSGSILDPIAKPIAWVLAEIYSLVPNYGVAIMVLSIIWMVLISPLTLKSTRSMLAMQKLQPQLKKLQAQHGSDRQAFAAAQMELFKEHQVSPFGSCLPMLLPMPVFFALFRVIDGLSHSVKPRSGLYGCNLTMVKCWDPKYLSSSSTMFRHIVNAHGQLNAFGMDLSHNALSAHNGFLAALPFWILLLVMAGTSYFQSAQMMNRNKAALAANPQMRMMKYLPLLFVVFCIRFPAGVIVYYAMSNVCRIVQQDFMYRFDPKVKALVAQEVEEVEELTHEIDEGRAPRGGVGAKPKVGGAGGAGGAGGGKRSRFGDLLAQAAEQQQRNAQAKAKGGGKGSSNGSSAGNGKAAGNGKTSSARSGNGSSNAGKRQPRPGGRTNRKRRGKR